LNKKPLNIASGRGYKTLGNQYKHRYVKKECPECKNEKAYIDRWHTRLKFTCMKRDCRQEWYIKRWEETSDGRRDTYPDYVGPEGMTLEDALRDIQRVIPYEQAN
jgi:hypothetical protein